MVAGTAEQAIGVFGHWFGGQIVQQLAVVAGPDPTTSWVLPQMAVAAGAAVPKSGQLSGQPAAAHLGQLEAAVQQPVRLRLSGSQGHPVGAAALLHA